jgi:hypothetical protein
VPAPPARTAVDAIQNPAMSTDTSIGPGTNQGGNESHGNADGCGNKTLGDQARQQPPAGAEVAEEAELPAGSGARPRPGEKEREAR